VTCDVYTRFPHYYRSAPVHFRYDPRRSANTVVDAVGVVASDDDMLDRTHLPNMMVVVVVSLFLHHHYHYSNERDVVDDDIAAHYHTHTLLPSTLTSSDLLKNLSDSYYRYLDEIWMVVPVVHHGFQPIGLRLHHHVVDVVDVVVVDVRKNHHNQPQIVDWDEHPLIWNDSAVENYSLMVDPHGRTLGSWD